MKELWVSLRHLDSESYFRLFQLGRAENVNTGVCIWSLTKANRIFCNIQIAVCSHRPNGCRKKISQSIFYLNTEMKWNVFHATYTHECFYHGEFSIKQVLMTLGNCDTILEMLILKVFCWLCAHIYCRNVSLLNHFYTQLPTNYSRMSSYANSL